VVFQDRRSEGDASRTSTDFSRDDYFCLSFNGSRARKDALDAVSCASVFSSDKGRFITQADIDAHYAEPYEPAPGAGVMRPLSMNSPYPPRSDIRACVEGDVSCHDHPDATEFGPHVREVMPEIDAVTMATPAGNIAQRIMVSLPSAVRGGDYRVCLEINTEGDYNENYDDRSYPTPTTPARWDTYALGYGYPYRGQPSVVYCAAIELGADRERTYSTDTAEGSSGPHVFDDPEYGQLQSMTGVSDDAQRAPGSGADRLRLDDQGARLSVRVQSGDACSEDLPPSALHAISVEAHPDRYHAHQWAMLSFGAAADDHAVVRYEVRVSSAPITDDASFDAALPAKQATEQAEELLVPTGAPPGETIRVALGGLSAQTEYYVAARAMDGCTRSGPLSVTQFTTPPREFKTVTPCFVASAVFGDPLERRVGVLRRMRDRHLRSHAPGRALVHGYYAIGPQLADAVTRRPWLRDASRVLLSRIVTFAEQLER
jgi:hypothetical protein